MSGSRGLKRRLVGVQAPTVRLPFALEGAVSLAELAWRRSLVVFFYPDIEPSSGDEGEVSVDVARAWSWREHEPELDVLGYMVVGVGTQSPEELARFASDELLGYMLLSDSELRLARVLGLPTRSVAGGRMYESLTMVFQDGRIARVFYPVDRARDAASVTNWIRNALA